MEHLQQKMLITQKDCDDASKRGDAEAFKYAIGRCRRYRPPEIIDCCDVEIAQIIVSIIGEEKFIHSMADYPSDAHSCEYVHYLLDIGYRKGDGIGYECLWMDDLDIIAVLCERAIDIIYSDVVDDPACLKYAIDHGYVISRDDFDRAINLINYESLELIHRFYPSWTGNLGTPDRNSANECPSDASIEDIEKCRQLGHTFGAEIACTAIEVDDVLKLTYLCENGLNLRRANYIRVALRYSSGVECLIYLVRHGLNYEFELTQAVNDGITTSAVNLLTQNKRRKA